MTSVSRPLTLGGRFHDAARAMLRARADLDVTVAGVRLRATSIPLVKRTAEGLQQVVRVDLEAASAGRVLLTLRTDEQVLVERSVKAAVGRNVEYLLVSEVDKTTPCTFDITVGESRASAALELRPQRHWRIFLIHQSHLDIGYTDPQDMILHHHAAFLDAVLDLAERSDALPDDARFRWNVEATWPLDYWLRTRPAADRRRFLDLAKAGRIEVAALSFNMHSEIYSIDELARQLAVAQRLRDEYEISIDTAMQTDVPGTTVGLLNLLTEAGVRYLSVAHNYAGRSVPHLLDGQRLTRPFRWRAASGKSLLTWYTDTPHGVAYMEGNLVGFGEAYEAAIELFPAYLAALAEQPYPYVGAEAFGWSGMPPGTSLARPPYPHDILHFRVNGELADNAPPSLVLSEIVRKWNSEWEYPHIRLATNREFFEVAERELGDRVETFEGDWTDWWADGVGSAARELGFNRSAQVLTPVAQAIHTLSDALGGEESEWQHGVEAAYEAMGPFDEHTWGAANPWTDGLEQYDSGALQWQRKSDFARQARDLAVLTHEHATMRLGRLLAAPDRALGALAQLAVFNPSGWGRTDIVEVFLPATRVAQDQRFELIDEASGGVQAYELTEQAHAVHRPRGRWLRFVAQDVPPLGYRRYLLRNEPSALVDESAAATTLESSHYRAEVDVERGTLSSLVDLAARRELLQVDSPFAFNQYVYDQYGSASNFNHLSGRIPWGGMWLLGRRSVAEQGVVVERSRTSLADRVRIRLRGEGSDWIETTYELLRQVPRVDIRNRVHKLPLREKESVYFAFPLRADKPNVACEITGGVDTTGSPRVPGSARHMRAIRHWITFDDGEGQVAWATAEAPLIEIGDLHLPYSPFPRTFESGPADQATVFSWAMNNIWDTNFPGRQGGETVFRYAVGSAAVGSDARRLGMQVAAGFSRPLVGMLCPPKPDHTNSLLPTGSFCEVTGSAVDIVTLAPAGDRGLTLYLTSLASEPVEFELRFPGLRVRDGAARGRLWPGEYRAVVVDIEDQVSP